MKPTLAARALALSLLAAGQIACASVPGVRSPYRVESVQELGPFLAAQLVLDQPRLGSLASFSSWATLSLLFPADAACRRVLEPGTILEYEPSGWEGTLSRGADACASVGIFNLSEWRDRTPRPETGSPVPRAQASFRWLRDVGEFGLVRGRFPLAGLVGFTGTYDILALVSTQGSCKAVAEEGVASLEFRSAGADALALVGAHGLCPIHALAGPDKALGELS